MFELLNVVSLLLAQNEAQKHETFIVLAVFALIGCVIIVGNFAKTPFTKEKKVQKPLVAIAFMILFVFFVVYFVMKYNNK